MQMIALLLLALAICGTTVQGMTQELRDFALKIHNDYRKNVPGACQMERMQYDLELEKQATAWANNCVFKHEIVKGRGENLAWNTAKDPETELMTNAAKSWYDEVNMYSYGQYSCSSSCHYTQMVWDRTNKVGCATKRCSYLVNAFADAWYFVCFYSPAGNMVGENPYQKQCTSTCKEGQTEDADGLCVGTATGGGGGNTGGSKESSSGGNEESEPCVDKDSRCPSWAKNKQCKSNPGYMLKNCRKSCKVCGGSTDQEESGKGEKEKESCVDKDTRCPNWAKGKQCRKNPGYMLKNCMKSCKVCVSEGEGETKNENKAGGNEGGKKEEGPCEDKRTQCGDWSKSGECKKNPGYMLKNCRKSCRVCTAKGEGENKKETPAGETEDGSQGDQAHEDKSKGCGGKEEETKTKTKEEGKGNKEKNGQGSTKSNKKSKSGDNKGGNQDKEESEESCPRDRKKCGYWKRRNLCTKNRKFMERRCKRACGFCTP